MYYAEVQLMFLRAHVAESAIGKLSESYDLSPRYIVGYETCTGLGFRARYWNYGETTENLTNRFNDLHLDLNVLDLEGTARFRTDRADLVVACGFRWADADVRADGVSASNDMPGLTVAADGRAWICQSCTSQWSGVCGARWSILGGDWEGGSTPNSVALRDDNISVQELYGGFEYLRYLNNCNLYARIVFEMQNWDTDGFGTTGNVASLGFVGPGVHVGMTY